MIEVKRKPREESKSREKVRERRHAGRRDKSKKRKKPFGSFYQSSSTSLARAVASSPSTRAPLAGIQRSSNAKGEAKKQIKNSMRLSLAALAQIGRLPTPPAAVLEAVSSETKVRDFFREVSVWVE